MSMKKDWMERQIEAIGNSFAAILFGKDKVKSLIDIEMQEDESSGSIEDDILERMVKKYLSEQNFNEAENLIFNSLEAKKNAKRLMIALSFYNELNQYDEETLLKNNYSKEEIDDGINKLKTLYE